MRAPDRRSEAKGNPRLVLAVRRFFGHAARGEWDKAVALCSDPVDILGHVIARAELARNRDRSLPDHVSELRELPPAIRFSLHEQRKLFGGRVLDTARVCFVTLSHGRGRDALSYGVVVDMKNRALPLLVRLFDPTSFKRFAEQVPRARQRTPR